MGIFGKAILAAGAAFAGWKIGEWISNTEAIGDAIEWVIQKLTGLKVELGTVGQGMQKIWTDLGVGAEALADGQEQLGEMTVKLYTLLKDKYGVAIERNNKSLEDWNTELQRALPNGRTAP